VCPPHKRGFCDRRKEVRAKTAAEHHGWPGFLTTGIGLPAVRPSSAPIRVIPLVKQMLLWNPNVRELCLAYSTGPPALPPSLGRYLSSPSLVDHGHDALTLTRSTPLANAAEHRAESTVRGDRENSSLGGKSGLEEKASTNPAVKRVREYMSAVKWLVISPVSPFNDTTFPGPSPTERVSDHPPGAVHCPPIFHRRHRPNVNDHDNLSPTNGESDL